ncbi:TadE-like protein [Pirellulimonas nuda]|uniref:TadE-like protein n=1 Tax=Pirellulimonas nuda TaxID=2528009 RepID=A0A518D6Z5_9BACT|nr:TadE family protein [Pirellulimonas nuda]QDU87225.1 TadE-like protein [Pirellulimonas nuda]
MTRNRSPKTDRRGAVAVEFAVIAPVLMAIAVGMIEVNRVYEAQNLLATAAREGARFASMDREGLLRDGQTANQKLSDDVKTFLASNGIPRDSVQVGIKDHDNPSLDFDIDEPTNDLRLFEVQVSADYSGVSYSPVAPGDDYSMSATMVFRNGRATISQ